MATPQAQQILHSIPATGQERDALKNILEMLCLCCIFALTAIIVLPVLAWMVRVARSVVNG